MLDTSNTTGLLYEEISAGDLRRFERRKMIHQSKFSNYHVLLYFIEKQTNLPGHQPGSVGKCRRFKIVTQEEAEDYIQRTKGNAISVAGSMICLN